MAIVALGIFALTFFTIIPFTFSTSNPDYSYLHERIGEIGRGEKLNVSNLNNGNWTTACLFGGYTDPSIHMKKLGKVSLIDRVYQPLKGWSWWRLGQVEEHEIMVAYVDNFGVVTFVHLPNKNSSDRLEHHIQCIEKGVSAFTMPLDS